MATLGDSPQTAHLTAGSTAPSNSVAARAALVMSAVALVMSTFVAIETFNEDDFRDDVGNRLACLEKEGANDCGADGR